MKQRAKFIGTVFSFVGCPYHYGADGEPVEPAELARVEWPFPVMTAVPRAFDCSSLVGYAWFVATGKDWRRGYDCDRILRACRKVEKPRNGTLCFYGRVLSDGALDAQHVTVYQDGSVIGANGGGVDTTTLERAKAKSARVCIRKEPGYRGDLLGYYELPWTDEP